ncbi:MAG: hypothetical protein FWG88_08465 [Oscillospiraceae bacterium]|nr:hypothetical protein [Oscillospiraceae bacterium]
MQLFKKKPLAIILVIVLVLGMAGTVFAAWPSFQNTNTNNGIIATQPASNPLLVTGYGTDAYGNTDYTQPIPVSLPNNGAWTGVDVTPVLSNGYAYTLYNGGANGAQLAISTLATGATTNITLDGTANNVSQLSTPYLSGSTLYAATTYFTNQLPGTTSAGWTGAGVSGAGFSFPQNATTSITYSGLTIPANGYWEPQLATDINDPNYLFDGTLSGTITLTPVGGGASISLGTTQYYGGNWTLYNNSSPQNFIPPGIYNVTLTVNNGTSDNLTATSIEFLISHWNLWSVNVSSTPIAPTFIATGYGQANTPIGYDNSGNIYWGIFEGDRSYYQYAGSGSPIKYTPSVNYPNSGNIGDDFYWAGAASVSIPSSPSTNYMVFGSDSGRLYIRPANGAFATATYPNADTKAMPSSLSPQIRSSIASDGTNVYLTFRTYAGPASRPGYLAATPISTLIGAGSIASTVVEGVQGAVSTPVVSGNGIIYTGSSYLPLLNNNVAGSVQAFTYSGGTLTSVATIYTGDSVTSSPIVYSISTGPVPAHIDYIYFTTNADHSFDTTPVPNHNAYCYTYVPGAASASIVWNPITNGTFAPQGFASDDGYLVFGDDANRLYIYQ